MNFIICGGGSGGHVTPAIAIYEALKERMPDAKVSFVGRTGGRENKAYVDTGEPVICLDMTGINGKSPTRALKGIISATKALQRAKEIIRERSPSVVIGTGGYVSWPMLTAAQMMGIPTVIHESNAYPGLATRLVSKNATRVLLNCEDAGNRLSNKKNQLVIGNPLRRDFLNNNRRAARRRLGIREGDFFILSFGGSLGSKKLNEAAISLIESYSSKNARTKHLHATGESYYEALKEKDKANVNSQNGCLIVPYIDRMAEAMHAADLVICRCGAMTLAEICAVGVSAILVPSPNVSDDHQLKNGEMMVKENAAILIKESELTEGSLFRTVKALRGAPERLKALGENAKRLFSGKAAEKAADVILDVAAK